MVCNLEVSSTGLEDAFLALTSDAATADVTTTGSGV